MYLVFIARPDVVSGDVLILLIDYGVKLLTLYLEMVISSRSTTGPSVRLETAVVTLSFFVQIKTRKRLKMNACLEDVTLYLSHARRSYRRRRVSVVVCLFNI